MSTVIVLTVFTVGHAQSVIPTNDGYVTDDAHVFTLDEEQNLERRLATYDERTHNQIVILTLLNATGSTLESLGSTTMDRWSIGGAQGSGVLLLIDEKNQRAWISVTPSLTTVLPTEVTAYIVDQILLPSVMRTTHAQGVTRALDTIEKHIAREYTADRYEPSVLAPLLPYAYFLGLLLVIAAAAYLGRHQSWWLGGVAGVFCSVLMASLYGWWLTVPLMIVLGLFLDYTFSTPQFIGRGTRRALYRSSLRKYR